MRVLRLTHPALDFWIDVRLRQFDGRWLAVAELADGNAGDRHGRDALRGAVRVQPDTASRSGGTGRPPACVVIESPDPETQLSLREATG